MPKITYMLSIPVEVDYTYHEEEKRTWYYPGYPAHVEVNNCTYPDPKQIIEDEMGEIEEACMAGYFDTGGIDNEHDFDLPEFDEGGWE